MQSDKCIHLRMLQAVIARMAANSFVIKGWSVTLVVAVVALDIATANGLLVVLLYFPVLMFWRLDAYFLRQECLFRKLYDHVRCLHEEQINFSMNTKPFEKSTEGLWSVALSNTLLLFHGAIVAVVTVATMLSLRVVILERIIKLCDDVVFSVFITV